MITFSNLGKPEWGRLGNQLFQIASTIGIAYQNKQEVIFPRWEYAKYFDKPLPGGDLFHYEKYREKGQLYRKINLPSGNFDLLGFFQSEKYFLDVEYTIREQFAPSKEVIEYIDIKYNILLKKDTCSIHVRRGDYLKLSPAFPPQTLDYYRHAISQFPSYTQFIIFSDDISWCRKQFQGPSFTFIENEKDIIDLLLMSRCKNHIISNSSFSWWGAWLNPDPEKVVICPAWWYGPAVSMQPKRRARDIYARGFKPLLLPTEKTLLIHIYYIICNPFYKIYFNALGIIHKLSKNEFLKNIAHKIQKKNAR